MFWKETVLDCLKSLERKATNDTPSRDHSKEEDVVPLLGKCPFNALKKENGLHLKEDSK